MSITPSDESSALKDPKWISYMPTVQVRDRFAVQQRQSENRQQVQLQSRQILQPPPEPKPQLQPGQAAKSEAQRDPADRLIYPNLQLSPLSQYPNLLQEVHYELGYCLLNAAPLPAASYMEKADFDEALLTLVNFWGTNATLKLPSPIKVGPYTFSGRLFFVSRPGKPHLFFGFGTINSSNKNDLIKLDKTYAIWFNNRFHFTGVNPPRIALKTDGMTQALVAGNASFKFSIGSISASLNKSTSSDSTYAISVKNENSNIIFTGTCIRGSEKDLRLCPFLPLELIALNGTFTLDGSFFFVNIIISKDNKHVIFTYSDEDRIIKFPVDRFWALFNYTKTSILNLIGKINAERDMIKRCELLLRNIQNNLVDDEITTEDIEIIANNKT